MATEIIRRARPLLGTIFEIAAQGRNRKLVEDGVEEGFREASRLEAILSYHSPKSELTRLNRQAHLAPQSVSSETLEVLRFSLKLWGQSAGLFDVSVGKMLAEADFLPMQSSNPRSARSDSSAIHIHGSQVSFENPLTLDFGGVAKGFIVDRVLARLKDFELASATVNAGGDLALWAPEPVPVGIRSPLNPGKIVQSITLQSGALATSASYNSSKFIEGQHRIPICHPKLGCVRAEQKSVTVIAQSCMIADALTKIVWLDELGASAILAEFGALAIVLRESECGLQRRVLPDDGGSSGLSHRCQPLI